MYSSQRNSSTGLVQTLESLPMPKRPPSARYSRSGKMPSPRFASVVWHSPATAPLAARRATFRGIHVGRMDQAPAVIDRRVIQQPGDRARTAPGEAVGNLLLLFGDVDVDRPAVRDADGCVEFRPA